jgi:hypothetical protein
VCRFCVAAGGRQADKQLSGALVWSVAKLASITFCVTTIAFHWFDIPQFHTEGRLATMLIIPSSWSSQLGGHLPASNIFFGTVAGEKEDFYKESLACTIFTLF